MSGNKSLILCFWNVDNFFSQLIIILLIKKFRPKQDFVTLCSVSTSAKAVKRDWGQALRIRVNVFTSTSVSEKNMNPSIVSRPLRHQAQSSHPSGKIRNLWSCKYKLYRTCDSELMQRFLISWVNRQCGFSNIPSRSTWSLVLSKLEMPLGEK